MPKRLIFLDDDGNELQFYENDKGKLFLEAGRITQEEQGYFSGCVCFDKNDVKEIIEELQRIYKQLPD